MLRGFKQTLCAPEPRDPTDWDKTMFSCLLRRYRSAVDCYWDWVSGCCRPGYGISPFGGGRHLLTIELPELIHDWGNSSLGGEGAQTEPCAQEDPGERSSDVTRDWPRFARECPGVSGEVWVSGGLLQGWGHWIWQRMHGTFEGGPHYLHHLHQSFALGQITRREHSPTLQQKIGLKI